MDRRTAIKTMAATGIVAILPEDKVDIADKIKEVEQLIAKGHNLLIINPRSITVIRPSGDKNTEIFYLNGHSDIVPYSYYDVLSRLEKDDSWLSLII